MAKYLGLFGDLCHSRAFSDDPAISGVRPKSRWGASEASSPSSKTVVR